MKIHTNTRDRIIIILHFVSQRLTKRMQKKLFKKKSVPINLHSSWSTFFGVAILWWRLRVSLKLFSQAPPGLDVWNTSFTDSVIWKKKIMNWTKIQTYTRYIHWILSLNLQHILSQEIIAAKQRKYSNELAYHFLILNNVMII